MNGTMTADEGGGEEEEEAVEVEVEAVGEEASDAKVTPLLSWANQTSLLYLVLQRWHPKAARPNLHQAPKDKSLKHWMPQSVEARAGPNKWNPAKRRRTEVPQKCFEERIYCCLGGCAMTFRFKAFKRIVIGI